MAFDEDFVASRRQLRGVAESLIAGPQYRASGTIRLAVRPDGFTGTALPIAVRGLMRRSGPCIRSIRPTTSINSTQRSSSSSNAAVEKRDGP
jgi:hypothetical protein